MPAVHTQPAQGSGLNHELELFKVQVEKRLCEILGKRWQASGGGICLHNLYEELSARVEVQPAQGDDFATKLRAAGWAPCAECRRPNKPNHDCVPMEPAPADGGGK